MNLFELITKLEKIVDTEPKMGYKIVTIQINDSVSKGLFDIENLKTDEDGTILTSGEKM